MAAVAASSWTSFYVAAFSTGSFWLAAVGVSVPLGEIQAFPGQLWEFFAGVSHCWYFVSGEDADGGVSVVRGAGCVLSYSAAYPEPVVVGGVLVCFCVFVTVVACTVYRGGWRLASGFVVYGVGGEGGVLEFCGPF